MKPFRPPADFRRDIPIEDLDIPDFDISCAGSIGNEFLWFGSEDGRLELLNWPARQFLGLLPGFPLR